MGGEGADQFILRGDTFTSAAAFPDRILDFKPSEGDIIKLLVLPILFALCF
jgi:hypothetical protein